MKSQIEFPFLHPPISLQPEKERATPRIWIEHIAIHRALPVNEETLLRRMTLRRGLNILWAEPNQSNDDANARVRISGHATGKTTFCRFLRYLLGEERYGNDDFRRSFRDKFDNQGWIFGEVWVEGRRWLVGRPLGTGARPFAVQGPGIESLKGAETLPKGGFNDDYLEAIDACLFGSLSDKQLPSSGQQLGWDMLLQWIARDQESRFAKLLNWRSATSDSGSIELQEAEKENIVRVVLGLSTKPEQETMRKLAITAKDHKEAVENRRLYDFQIRTEFERINQLLDDPLSPDAPLPEAHARSVVEELEAKAVHLRALIEEDDSIKALVNKVKDAKNQTALAEARWVDAKEIAEQCAEEIEIAEGTKSEAERTHKKRDWEPFRNHCSAKLTDEVLNECRFARQRKPDDELDKELDEIRSSAGLLRFDKQRADGRVMELFEALEKAKSNEEEQSTRLESAKEKYKPALNQADGIDRQVESIKLALNNLTRALAAKSENEDNILGLGKEKEQLSVALEKSKAQHALRMGELSEMFRFVVRSLLGPDVDAGVEFSGKSIYPHVDFHGRMDSAALETVRLLAFDIACLLDSYVRNASMLPGFLIHDSPREADLSVDIYHEIFRLMQRMEKESQKEDYPFQYIITTTEPPPEDMRQDPWLLEPVLNATEPERRFLGVDV